MKTMRTTKAVLNYRNSQRVVSVCFVTFDSNFICNTFCIFSYSLTPFFSTWLSLLLFINATNTKNVWIYDIKLRCFPITKHLFMSFTDFHNPSRNIVSKLRMLDMRLTNLCTVRAKMHDRTSNDRDKTWYLIINNSLETVL